MVMYNSVSVQVAHQFIGKSALSVVCYLRLIQDSVESRYRIHFLRTILSMLYPKGKRYLIENPCENPCKEITSRWTGNHPVGLNKLGHLGRRLASAEDVK